MNHNKPISPIDYKILGPLECMYKNNEGRSIYDLWLECNT